MRPFLFAVIYLTTISLYGQITSLSHSGPVCPGSDLTVYFTHNGINPTNTFTITLSGGYYQYNISTTVAGNTATSVILHIPSDFPPIYYGYYLGVSSSSPSFSYSNHTVVNIGVYTPIIQGTNGTTTFCNGSEISLDVFHYLGYGNGKYPAGYTLKWFKNGVDITSTNESNIYGQFQKSNATNNDAGVYTVKASVNNDECYAISYEKSIHIIPIPIPPLMTVSPNPIPNGTVVMLSTTSCPGGYVNLYTGVVDVNPFGSFYDYSSYQTEELTESVSYYASCTIGSCVSPTRTLINLQVDTTGAPKPPILTALNNNVCPGEIAKLSASGCSGIVRWYDNSTSKYPIETDNEAPYEYNIYTYSGGDYSYYADCRENGVLSTSRSQVNITVKPVVLSPTLSNSYFNINSGSSVKIYASNCISGSVKWYDTYQGDNLLYTGNIFTKNNVTEYTTLYVSCTKNGCESTKNSVSINISSQVESPSIYVENGTICGSGSRILTAIGCSNGTVKWYNAYQDGNLLATGQTYATPTLTYNSSGGNNSYIYYADCTIAGTTSTYRSQSIYIYVYGMPSTTPTVHSVSIACNATATLTASGCVSSYPRWYANQTTSDYLDISNQYTTPNLQINTTYYVACSNGNCESDRIPVLVTVDCPQTPSPTISANPGNVVCAGNSVTLTATGCAGGTVNWSDGGTESSRTITPATNLFFTATCTKNALTSAPSNSLSITVNPKPALVITNPATVSLPSTVNLTAPTITNGSILPAGTVLAYFTNIGGTNVLNSPSAVTIAGTYYIKATSPSGCTDIKPVIVTISNCESAITLVSTADDYVSGSQLKKTNQTITATNKIKGTANVTYRSGKSVTLSQGFEADPGTVFKAEIGGCN